MTNKISFYPEQLGEAIYSWLNYISYTSESNVLAESSIRYPLAEFIERRLQRPVTLEFYHPCVPQPPTGHKKCIDFVFSKKEENIVNSNENEIGEERVYIELKYVSENNKNPNEKQRVFNDLVRLALVSTETNECYFILCGSNDDFRQYVKVSPKAAEEDSNRHNFRTYTGEETPQKRIRSDYTKWLYFKKTKEDKIKEISTDSDSVKSIKGTKNYKDVFYNKYKDKSKSEDDNSLVIPKTICTKLEYIMPVKDRKVISEKMMVAIWKVWAKSEEKNDDQKTS